MIYKVVKAISILLRLLVIPSPFVDTGYGFIYNLIAEPLLHSITFVIAGLYYKKGINDPAVGSALYLFFYWLHTGLILIMGHFDWNKAIVALILIIYLGVNIVIRRIKQKLFFYQD